MFKKILVTAASSMIALSAFASTADPAQSSIPLKDGTTVYVFADGKMGMQDKYGRAVSMEPGQVMETRDGKTVNMIGNEKGRLESFLKMNNFD